MALKDFSSSTADPPALANAQEHELRAAAPTTKKIDVKTAIGLSLNPGSKLMRTVNELARSDPDENRRREFLIALIAGLFKDDNDLADLAKLLDLYGLASKDHPALSTPWYEWPPAQREQRRLQILEMVATRLPEETLSGLAESNPDGSRKQVWFD